MIINIKYTSLKKDVVDKPVIFIELKLMFYNDKEKQTITPIYSYFSFLFFYIIIIMRDCCKSSKRNKKCIRKDGKTFSLPRRFSKKKCLTNQRGFTMRASCAPYKFCKKSKKNKIKGKGREHEVPFLLKEVFSKKGVYEPGLVDKILTNVPKKSVTKAINDKKLMAIYKKHVANKAARSAKLAEINSKLDKLEGLLVGTPYATDDSYDANRALQKSKLETQLKEKVEELKKIKEQLQKPKIISSDGPARNTRSASIKRKQSEYTTLTNNKKKIEKEIDNLTLKIKYFTSL